MSKWEDLIEFADNEILHLIIKATCGECREDVECDNPVCPATTIHSELVEQVAGAGLEFMKTMIDDFSRNSVEK